MEGHNRHISDWLNDASRGVLLLPRFQRQEVWDRNRVVNFLTALIQERPIGYFLELHIDPDDPPFKTRPLAGIPAGTERCTRNLLDGQQRLTALWKSFNGRYAGWSPYLAFKKQGNVYEIGEQGVHALTHTRRNQAFIGKPAEEFQQGILPVTVLNPVPEVRGSSPVVEWRRQAARDDAALEAFLEQLRIIIASSSIPALTLPRDTDREVAVDVFIESNKSSLQLSHYDLAVAQMERQTEESLQELVDDLRKKVPNLERIEPRDVGDLVLKVACLWQGKKPTLGAYESLDFEALQSDRAALIDGFKWAVKKHEALGITGEARLPTSVPLRVLPVLHRSLAKLRGAGPINRAETIVDRYLWRAFLTDRYERDANTRLKEDHDKLSDALQGSGRLKDVPAFGLSLPTVDDFISNEAGPIGWPKSGSRLARAALLALSQGGAIHLSSANTFLLRELHEKSDFHHIFPKNALKKYAPEAIADTVLNCMLLKPEVNREWTEKLPGDYLPSIVDETSQNRVNHILGTHMLELDELLECTEDRSDQIPDLYLKFLKSRAERPVNSLDTLVTNGL